MRTPFTYHSDPAVPKFDDSQPLIIFDGHCVLCSRGVLCMIARDPDGTTKFAAIQEPVPRALYRHYALDADSFDTFMVLLDGMPHTKWKGVLAAARTMPHPWRGFGALGRFIPSVIGDRIYDYVQRNRLRWFGSRETCLAPTPTQRQRFLTSA